MIPFGPVKFLSLLLGGLLIWSQFTFAQVTTARLRGLILDPAGEPLAGVRIVLKDARTKERSTVTNDQGQFAYTGLKVGGPYTIAATKAGYQDLNPPAMMLSAGNNQPLDLVMQTNNLERMTVEGTRDAPSMSGRNFDAADIANAPAVGRDPKDLIRMAADAYVDGDKLVLGGANNRFNSITIDGIRQDDDFGLNDSGYPTQRSPISMESVQELSVNRTPFDVRYGNFIGGNVNVITKSGTNDVEASIFTTHTNDKWVGKKTKDRKVASDFDETRLGFTLGGPIVEDEIHFFVTAEGLQAQKPNLVGVAGSGFGNESNVTADQLAQVQNVASQVYGFPAGSTGVDQMERDFKVIAKVDWAIDHQHHLEAKFQRSTGNNITDQYFQRNKLKLTSNWYNRIDSMDTKSLKLTSDWTDDLSTKFEVSHKKVSTLQNPLEGGGFMEAEVTVNDEGDSVVLGPDPFRHANELDNETFHLGLEANLLVGDHLITGGWEQDRVDIFNLFGPYSNGQAEYDSIADFAAQTPSFIYYQNAISNQVEDLAANWGYDVSTLFLQDEWQVTSKLTARFGIRGERYSNKSLIPHFGMGGAIGDSRNSIRYNSNFEDRHGFANTTDLDGKYSLLPRLGLSYKPVRSITLTGGLGVYGGGAPNVWISNSYSNDGIIVDAVSSNSAAGFDGRTIPADLQSQLQAGDGNVDALDPDFKLPESFKFSTGALFNMDLPLVGRSNLDLNYTYSKVRYGLMWKDLNRNHSAFAHNQATAKGPDGRDLFDTNPADDTDNDFDRSRGYDMLLTNTDKGFGHTASLSWQKYFDFGLSLSGSYAWQKVQDVNPAGSSRSVSNYGKMAAGIDPNNPELARSDYEREHRFVLTSTYEASIFQNLISSVGLFFERRSGQPYSYTFGGDRSTLGGLFGENVEFAKRERMLFYVPKGDGSDVELDGIDEAEFNAYLSKTGLERYRGRIAPRNAFKGNWVDNIDIRFAQELPGFGDQEKARLVLDIENLPNLLNSKWGQVKEPGFPYLAKVVDVDYNASTGKYVYSNLQTEDANNNVKIQQSIWKMQLSFYYNF